ncbi:MAG: hypothetical protein KBC48_02095 [Candidatus Pacebacteria bacterium]|nr:hypothetical protein [Candidatus Paceibacterota bacterium]
MRKVERLQQVVERFGSEFVLPYRVCHSWGKIEEAVREFESQGQTWGVRTDFATGFQQGFDLPFELHGTLEKVRAMWDKNGSELEYIVSWNILANHCQAVAIVVDEEHMFFEYNPFEPEIAQRDMYKNPDNLRHLIVGPFRRSYLPHRQYSFRVFQLEDPLVRSLCFDIIYQLGLKPSDEEVTFTVRSPDKKVIIW